jgi:hypothetical protein
LKNYKGQLPLSKKQKIAANQADLKKKSHDGGSEAPKLEGPRVILPTSLYGQFASACECLLENIKRQGF